MEKPWDKDIEDELHLCAFHGEKTKLSARTSRYFMRPWLKNLFYPLTMKPKRSNPNPRIRLEEKYHVDLSYTFLLASFHRTTTYLCFPLSCLWHQLDEWSKLDKDPPKKPVVQKSITLESFKPFICFHFLELAVIVKPEQKYQFTGHCRIWDTATTVQWVSITRLSFNPEMHTEARKKM